jgi:hypothetical protein
MPHIEQRSFASNFEATSVGEMVASQHGEEDQEGVSTGNGSGGDMEDDNVVSWLRNLGNGPCEHLSARRSQAHPYYQLAPLLLFLLFSTHPRILHFRSRAS